VTNGSIIRVKSKKEKLWMIGMSEIVKEALSNTVISTKFVKKL
jgi:hypothetical protein